VSSICVPATSECGAVQKAAFHCSVSTYHRSSTMRSASSNFQRIADCESPGTRSARLKTPFIDSRAVELQGSSPPVAGSRRTTTLVLPPCSRSGSKTALQAAHRPRLRTLENQLFSTNPPAFTLY
jgi:hypothetical protein